MQNAEQLAPGILYIPVVVIYLLQTVSVHFGCDVCICNGKL